MPSSRGFRPSQRQARVAECVLDVFLIALTLMLVMDPLGNIPAFMAALAQAPAERQGQVIFRGCLFALGNPVGDMGWGKQLYGRIWTQCGGAAHPRGACYVDRLAHDISIAPPRTVGTG